MSSLTTDQLAQLQATARALFVEGLALVEALPPATERAADGCSELVEVLHARRATSGEAELKDLLDGAAVAHCELFEFCKQLAASVALIPEEMVAAGDLGGAQARREISNQKIEPRIALAHAKASLAFDLMQKHFTVGMAALALSQAIDGYIAVTEGFLGRKPASARVGLRLARVGEAFVKDVAGLVAPPFGGTTYELFRQCTESQMQRDIAAFSAETGDRLFSLRRVQTGLRAHMDFLRKIIDISRDAGASAAFRERRALTIAEDAVDDVSDG